jgi:hypothetical protein
MKPKILEGYIPLRLYAKLKSYHPNTIRQQIRKKKLQAIQSGRFWYVKND